MPTKQIKNSTEEFIIKLQTLFDIENVLLKAIPKMEKGASNEELKNGFRDHLEETKMHIIRLEDAFALLEQTLKKLKSEGIRGIIEDGARVLEVNAEKLLKDTMIASAVRHVEHYEMAGYITAIAEAESLKLGEIAGLLNETLGEEMGADEKLCMIVKDKIEN